MTSKKIIVAGGDNYNTLGIIRSLGEYSYRFDTILIKGKHPIASKSKYLKSQKLVVVDTPTEVYEYLFELKANFPEKAYVVVEGDQLTGILDRHYNELVDNYIWNNAGEQGRLTEYLQKYKQIETARECGIEIAETYVVEGKKIPNGLRYPVITKATTSEVDHWKSEAFLCNNEKELEDALNSIRSPRVLVQQYIEKENEYCIDGFSINHGKETFISMLCKYKYIMDNNYSYYFTEENLLDGVLRNRISEFMRKVGYDGIWCIEFLLGKDGHLYFLENNFRNSGWSYASTCAGMSLPALWIEATEKGSISDIEEKQFKEEFTCMEEVEDFKRRVVGRKTNVFKWLQEYCECDCKLIAGRHDFKPLLSYISSRIIHKIRGKRC